MPTAQDINTTLERRRFHKLRGVPKWRIELIFRPGYTQSGEADTVKGAWNAVVAGANILSDIKVTSPCPWNEKGERIR